MKLTTFEELLATLPKPRQRAVLREIAREKARFEAMDAKEAREKSEAAARGTTSDSAAVAPVSLSAKGK